MSRFDPRKVAVVLAAPALALVVALALSSLVLAAVGNPVVATFTLMAEYGTRPRIAVLIINQATTFYLAGVAVAIGFRMNLFNIGVDGQYRLAAFCAAAVGGAVTLPAPLHVIVIIAVAVVVGALWAGIAALLKVTRGVSEVISTIMLNAIATSLTAYLLRELGTQSGNNIGTAQIAPSGRIPGIPLIPGAPDPVYGFVLVAALVGVAYAVLLNRTRFGFDLRATGRSESAAVASGVNVKRMVLYSMLLSGAVAGLVGMPLLLGASYTYSLTFPAGLGFTGIAIALLGRNHPVGIAVGALLFAYLQSSSQVLAINDVSPEIVTIMQGIIVLAVVIAYELVRRYTLAGEARRVARALEIRDEPTPAQGARA